MDAIYPYVKSTQAFLAVPTIPGSGAFNGENGAVYDQR